MPSGALRFSPLTPSDQDKLWDWLHIALWDPPPAGLRPRATLLNPGVRIYAEQWAAPSDVGIVARLDDVDIGACWMRLLPEGVGLAYVDAQTPQLGVALEAPHQRQGHGAPMMRAALAAARDHGYPAVSLTVHPENPARRLYERVGFREAGLRAS